MTWTMVNVCRLSTICRAHQNTVGSVISHIKHTGPGLAPTDSGPTTKRPSRKKSLDPPPAATVCISSCKDDTNKILPQVDCSVGINTNSIFIGKDGQGKECPANRGPAVQNVSMIMNWSSNDASFQVQHVLYFAKCTEKRQGVAKRGVYETEERAHVDVDACKVDNGTKNVVRLSIAPNGWGNSEYEMCSVAGHFDIKTIPPITPPIMTSSTIVHWLR
uniref:Uncharacterized protein n=1 Tax=Romanomermis culicivorax TaxID=13658 RepID=A0A915IBX9_ROMCU